MAAWREVMTAESVEFSRRRSLPHVEVRHMPSKRGMDVALSYCGHDLGARSVGYTRGKPSSVMYVLPTLPACLTAIVTTATRED